MPRKNSQKMHVPTGIRADERTKRRSWVEPTSSPEGIIIPSSYPDIRGCLSTLACFLSFFLSLGSPTHHMSLASATPWWLRLLGRLVSNSTIMQYAQCACMILYCTVVLQGCLHCTDPQTLGQKNGLKIRSSYPPLYGSAPPGGNPHQTCRRTEIDK